MKNLLLSIAVTLNVSAYAQSIAINTDGSSPDSSAIGSNAVITVVDSKGAVVQQTRKSILAGMNQLMINMSNLSSGVYTVRVNYGSNVKEARVVKK